jgi:hypothetical protein
MSQPAATLEAVDMVGVVVGGAAHGQENLAGQAIAGQRVGTYTFGGL